MTNPQVLHSVRRYLRQWYSHRHNEAACPLEESILIRGGFYCGRRFHFGPYQAVWFVEEQQVKISDEQGTTLEAVDLRQLGDEEPTYRPARAA